MTFKFGVRVAPHFCQMVPDRLWVLWYQGLVKKVLGTKRLVSSTRYLVPSTWWDFGVAIPPWKPKARPWPSHGHGLTLFSLREVSRSPQTLPQCKELFFTTIPWPLCKDLTLIAARLAKSQPSLCCFKSQLMLSHFLWSELLSSTDRWLKNQMYR